RLGVGRTLAFSIPLSSVGLVLVPVAHGSKAVAVAILVAGFLVYGFGSSVFNVHSLSVRMTIPPLRLLARVPALYQSVIYGTLRPDHAPLRPRVVVVEAGLPPELVVPAPALEPLEPPLLARRKQLVEDDEVRTQLVQQLGMEAARPEVEPAVVLEGDHPGDRLAMEIGAQEPGVRHPQHLVDRRPVVRRRPVVLGRRLGRKAAHLVDVLRIGLGLVQELQALLRRPPPAPAPVPAAAGGDVADDRVGPLADRPWVGCVEA